MSEADQGSVFNEGLQELSAALVLLEADDPGSYQETLTTLEELSSHPFAQDHPRARELLSGIQQRIQECIFDPDEYPVALAATEEDLQKLQRLASGDAEEREPEMGHDDTDESAEAELGGYEEEGERKQEGAGEASCKASMHEERPRTVPLRVTSENDRELYEDFLTEAGESIESIETNIIALEQDPQNLGVINEIFRPFHTIKGVSGFLDLHAINRLAHATEDLIDEARQGRITMGSEEIDRVLEAVDLVRRLLAAVRSGLEGNPSEDFSAEVDGFINRLAGYRGDSIEEQRTPEPVRSPSGQEGSLGGSEETAEQGTSMPEEVREDDAEVHPSAGTTAALAAVKPTGSSTVKVDMSKLDNLINMVGELVIAQSLIQQSDRIQSIMDEKLAKDFGLLSRITSELRDTTMVMRMVPMKQTFQKMNRLVRDLTRKSGKRVELQMFGEETEIDRNMVDALYDPLVHMVRNAIDHGIETPEDRRKVGKPEVGTLRFRSYHKAGNVVIEIGDDGKGLDRERIIRKATEKGLVSPDEKLTDTEIYQLTFRPGFSTAVKVTDVSGRGVGMDVVGAAIEGLRGSIEIDSRPGQGSTFIMKLPLTLAIIDGTIVRVGPERYVLPTLNVKEAVRPREEDCFTVVGKGEVIRIRGRLLPLIRLHEIFDVHSEAIRPWEGLVILAEYQEEYRCLLVDDILDKREVVVKSLGQGIQQPPGIAGGCIHGDGTVGLILDLNGVFRLGQGTAPDGLSLRAS
jgi:two-component system chemotaxis sensor kinase CheA